VPDDATEDARPDLAAMMVPLGRALSAGELPILAVHKLTMWAYIVLMALDDQPARTQAALAVAIGADKTRIIPVLDDLQKRGFIDRRPDPADRRGRLLSLTPSGHGMFRAAQTAIRGYEQRVLEHLPTADRAPFLRALSTLAALPWDAVANPGT